VYIHEGARVDVNVDAVRRSFVGRVARFTGDLNPATGTMQTEIDVENRDLSLTPGMYANATIELERHDNVLTIPVSAVIRSGDHTSVLAVDKSSHVQSRSVKLGLQESNIVEVTSGLAEGNLVITGGQSNYQPGEAVRTNLEQVKREAIDEERSGGTK